MTSSQGITETFSNIEFINKVFETSEDPIPTSVVIDLLTEAVSFQSSSAKKEKIKSLIRSITKKAKFVVTGNVAVSIVWHLSEQEHYESDSPPDVDNIVKPILDALCGVDGILVDDCQITSINCSWIDWDREGQKVYIEIDFFDDWSLRSKNSLVFVQFEKALCFMTASEGTPRAILETTKIIEVMFRFYFETRQREGNYYAGIHMRPAQRIFHISRLSGRGFPIVKLENFQIDLESKMTEEERNEVAQKINKLAYSLQFPKS